MYIYTIVAQLVPTILAKMKKSLVLLAFNPFLLRWYCLLTTNLNFKYIVLSLPIPPLILQHKKNYIGCLYKRRD